MKETRAFDLTVLAVIVTAVAGTLLYFHLRANVSMPGPTASPQDVVLAYTKAIQKRDFKVSNQLTDPPDHLGFFSARPMSYHDAEVAHVGHWRHQVVVYVDMDTHKAGLQLWAFWLKETDQGWRIVSQGLG